MLRRINAGLFEEDEDSDIELAVKAKDNNGTQAARFDYNSAVLAADTVQGFPGCRFRVKPGTRQFRALVVFDAAAPPDARYDLFQVNAAGTLTAVGKSVTVTGGTPLIGFGIAGMPVTAAAGAATGRRKMPKAPRRGGRKTTSARRKATRTPAAAPGKVKSAAKRKQPKKPKRVVRTKRPNQPKRPRRAITKKR